MEFARRVTRGHSLCLRLLDYGYMLEFATIKQVPLAASCRAAAQASSLAIIISGGEWPCQLMYLTRTDPSLFAVRWPKMKRRSPAFRWLLYETLMTTLLCYLCTGLAVVFIATT